MNKLLLPFIFLIAFSFGCGSIDPLPVDAGVDATVHPDAQQKQMVYDPPEYRQEPPRYAEPMRPERKHTWEDFIINIPPEPPPCLVCEQNGY